MQAKIRYVCNQVLFKISPTAEERKKILAVAKELEQKVVVSAKKRGVEAVVRLEGSLAKDTWLKEEPDIDVFMCLPPAIPRKTLGTVSLDIAREATEGWGQVERFAEHPYLEAFVEGFRVNIVPCYCTGSGEWLSATDRTPFHTDYVNKRLNQNLRSEVRLLKRFLQGIGVYGAEIKVGGFSGYLCELLVIHFGSFVETLRAFTKYAARWVIDIENYYAGREKDLNLLFDEPFLVIDPVDKGRNVASAVKPQKIYTLIAASRTFLRMPSERFFFPPKTKALTAKEFKARIKERGSDCLFLTFRNVDAVPDILWGQLYKTQRAIRKLLELYDFKVLRDAVWSDEKSLSAFIFELEQHTIPNIRQHLGPPLEREEECGNFLAKYRNNGSVVSGPFIEDGRLMVEVTRKCTDAVELLKAKLNEGGRNMGVADLISDAFKDGFNLSVNGEVSEVYIGNKAFAEFLTDFLDGKPFWLKPEEA